MPAPRSAARVTGPSSPRLFQQQLLPSGPDGQHSLDLGSGGPGSGQKAAFYSRHAAPRLTPTRSAAKQGAAAGTRTPARRCAWRRCPRSCCCCCCCRRPVSRAGPRAGARHPHGPPRQGSGRVPRRLHGLCWTRAPLPAPGRMGFGSVGVQVGRGVEKGVLAETLTGSACLPTPESSPCDSWPALGHSWVGLADRNPRSAAASGGWSCTDSPAGAQPAPAHGSGAGGAHITSVKFIGNVQLC